MTIQEFRTARPTAPAEATSHRQTYHVRIARKILAEFSHERALTPVATGPGSYVVASADGRTEYHFRAEILSLENWAVDESSLRRVRDGEELPVDAIALVIDLAPMLGIGPQALPDYLEEFINTLALSADRPRRTAHQRSRSRTCRLPDHREGDDRGPPPASSRTPGVWGGSAPTTSCTTRRRWATRSGSSGSRPPGGLRRRDGRRRRLRRHARRRTGSETLADFDAVLRESGCDPDDYRYLPVHPWQWVEKVEKLYSADIADRRIVWVGESPDVYQAQQSIRTVFNATTPTRNYVKVALSIVNMGFTRGMSADYMRTTPPLINNWVRGLVADDPYLSAIGFEMIYEVAAVGYRSPTFTPPITQPGSEYRKILSALWRQSPPIPLTGAGEQLSTMAALLHLDHHGDPLVGAFIERSGIPPAAEWVRRYLRTYLHPITYLLYRYELKFSPPHGENLILVLDNGGPVAGDPQGHRRGGVGVRRAGRSTGELLPRPHHRTRRDPQPRCAVGCLRRLPATARGDPAHPSNRLRR